MKSIIEMGSGTGVLLPHFLARVGSQGRVAAFDLSPCKSAISRSKYSASNLCFVAVEHIEGRKAINSMHGEKASQVSRQLEPVAELALLAESCGFETVVKEDNDEFYILLTKLRE